MKTNSNDLKRQVLEAINACQEKKAEEISILELEKGSGAFTDYFVVCSGSNPRQIQAISDEVELRLKNSGLRPAHVDFDRRALGGTRLLGRVDERRQVHHALAERTTADVTTVDGGNIAAALR